MTYLDWPRIHFGGAFVANPSTINNLTTNYLPDVPLTTPSGGYDPNVALWNPIGVAQFFLRGCRVTQVLDSSGRLVPSSDPLAGALVLSPSPFTPVEDGKGGVYGIPKIVDLDPDQQGRTALYGLRVALSFGNDVALNGVVSVPELRDLWFTRMGRKLKIGSYQAVGRWEGALRDPVWNDAVVKRSPALLQLKSAARGGLSLKLTVDLHRNDPSYRFTEGDQFDHGRVMGTLGPLAQDEPEQFVPGRRLEPPATSPQGLLWGPAQFVVRSSGSGTRVTIDLGGALPITYTESGGSGHPAKKEAPRPTYASDGSPAVTTGITLAVQTPTGTRPLTHGAIARAGKSVPFDESYKRAVLWVDSGVVDVPLTDAEAGQVATTGLALLVGSEIVLAEDASGRYLDTDTASLRLEQGESGAVTLRSYAFGVARAEQPLNAEFHVQKVVWYRDDTQDPPWNSQPEPSNDLSLSWDVQTDGSGSVKLRIQPNETALGLVGPRVDLDSVVYYIGAKAPGTVSDNGKWGAAGGQFVSVLLWRKYVAPANPTWENDVGPLLANFARVYPGMRDKLDLSNRETVVSARDAMIGHLSQDRLDPAYMPVTRELSDAKIRMILSWLRAQEAPASGGNA